MKASLSVGGRFGRGKKAAMIQTTQIVSSVQRSSFKKVKKFQNVLNGKIKPKQNEYFWMFRRPRRGSAVESTDGAFHKFLLPFCPLSGCKCGDMALYEVPGSWSV